MSKSCGDCCPFARRARRSAMKAAVGTTSRPTYALTPKPISRMASVPIAASGFIPRPCDAEPHLIIPTMALLKRVYNPEEESRDLGFGSLLTSRRELRMLNRDGSFNVQRPAEHGAHRFLS